MSCDHGVGDLFVHRCAKAPINSPGVHAVVVGTSFYPQSDRRGLGPARNRLRDLPGAALGAARFANWLATEFKSPAGLPLLTVRVLLQPIQPESARIVAEGVRYTVASTENVRIALEEWRLDCDSNPNNVALMYMAGHGMVTGGAGGVSTVFLSEANAHANPYDASINMALIQEAMEFCSAKYNIYITDCCAKREKLLGAVVGGNGITFAFSLDDTSARSDLLTIAAAKVGLSSYALNATDGTLLSYVLLPLLAKAGEIVEGHFVVTPGRLARDLPIAVRSELKRRNAAAKDSRQEPRVRGNCDYRGIHRPDPPPPVNVDLELKEKPGQLEVNFLLLRSPNTVVESGIISSGTLASLWVDAGRYILKVRPGSPGELTFSLDIARHMRFDVMTGQEIGSQ